MQYKRNHFVPSFYVKQWFIPSTNELVVYDYDPICNKFAIHKLKLRNAGNVKILECKLYWYKTNNPDKQTTLEIELGNSESDIAKILNKTHCSNCCIRNIRTQSYKLLSNLIYYYL